MNHVLLFDIDGTLLLTSGAGGSALGVAMEVHFGVTELARVELHGRTDRNIAGQLFRNHGIEDTEENWLILKEAYLGCLSSKLAENGGTLLPGIPALLEQLAAREDVHLGLLTGNCAAGAKLKLGYFGLDHFFEFGGYGDEHASRDDVARVALEETGRHIVEAWHPDNLWVIGDTIHDITCARAIGAKVVAVATGGNSLSELQAENPDLAFETLEDHAALLAGLGL